MKIIQIIGERNQGRHTLYGLSNDGMLYMWGEVKVPKYKFFKEGKVILRDSIDGWILMKNELIDNE